MLDADQDDSSVTARVRIAKNVLQVQLKMKGSKTWSMKVKHEV